MDADDDKVEPRLGRAKAAGDRQFLDRVIAAANRAGGRKSFSRGGRGFSGCRLGSGAGIGRVLSRSRAVAGRRRVIIKSSIARLAGKGLGSAKAHLRYIQRSGATRDGEPGTLYSATSDPVDGKAFMERCSGDRHQFRFIVSAEDGGEYEDLKDLTRRLMGQMEQDLGTRLDWVAANHFDTGHPHTHILLRGRDEHGQDLIIARDYVARGMRERAAELVELDLGPRSAREIRQRLRAEIEQDRMTSLDRDLLADIDAGGFVSSSVVDRSIQPFRTGRLRKLERMGLARVDDGRWRLAHNLRETLTRMGEREDIIRTMQRALARDGREPVPKGLAIFDPAHVGSQTLVGRVVERGLSDELRDRHYLIVDATDGRSWYVDIGRDHADAGVRAGAIVSLAGIQVQVRETDRNIAAVAAMNGGRYDADAHGRFDSGASDGYIAAHVRRLEAIRRLSGGVERAADGTWTIAPDYLERALAFEQARARERPISIDLLSPVPLSALIEADAATWLDRELASETPAPLRDEGFGAEVAAAKDARRQWLIAQDLAAAPDGDAEHGEELLGILRRRELLRIAAQCSRELGLDFTEHLGSGLVEGVLRRRVDALSGRYALIERSHDFTLVPWRPVLERHLGRQVMGRSRGSGISWSLGRSRSGPAVS